MPYAGNSPCAAIGNDVLTWVRCDVRGESGLKDGTNNGCSILHTKGFRIVGYVTEGVPVNC